MTLQRSKIYETAQFWVDDVIWFLSHVIFTKGSCSLEVARLSKAYEKALAIQVTNYNL